MGRFQLSWELCLRHKLSGARSEGLSALCRLCPLLTGTLVPSAQPGCRLQWQPDDCRTILQASPAPGRQGLFSGKVSRAPACPGDAAPGVPVPLCIIQMPQAPPRLKAVGCAEASATSQARGPSTGACGSLRCGTPGSHPALVLSSSSGRSICTPSPPRYLPWR